ncbi:OLC1v1014772C1 [Oldenlandia corymbosa var. corymbosa]|uniref:OLC1v1014772C1 n=1 Tax=Oldenlandia corymbosa var. corymbosa TaxID=529605 RepID=A0AAV1E3U7_OLDCO|nr:OLC1v1014772C1 [Oldenlandia corymbosa var. corymbosa]
MALCLRKPEPFKTSSVITTLLGSNLRRQTNAGAPFISSDASVHGETTSGIRGGAQTRLPNGSYVPLSLLFNSLTGCDIYRAYNQIPFILPHPSSFFAVQEKLSFINLRKLKFCNVIAINPNSFRGFCSLTDTPDEVEVEGYQDAEFESESEGDSGGNNAEKAISKADPDEVDRVCKVIDELFTLDRNMEAVLDESGVNLSHDLVVDVLERFKHARKPAFRFFCWASRRSDYAHDSRTYNAMMSILGKTRQFETMVSVLEEMGEKGLLTMETFIISMKAFVAAKERKKAIGMFELMKKYKLKVGVETVNCLLDAMGRAKLGKEAQIMFQKLEHRFTPNLQTYTVLLNGWCRVKNLVEAGKKRLREAADYFDEMMKSGCEPDAGVYTCLLTGYGNEKKMDKVYGLLKDMKDKGYPPDAQLFNALIKLMTNRRMPDDAVRIYKKMINTGIEPTIHTYNMMMRSFFANRNYDMGIAVWEEMNKKGCCPDDNSYVIIIGGLIRQGRSAEACKFLEEMIAKGMKAPQLDYNKFAADFSRAGRPDILEELAQKMRFSGKYEDSKLFARWAEMMKKRDKSRDPTGSDTDHWRS